MYENRSVKPSSKQGSKLATMWSQYATNSFQMRFDTTDEVHLKNQNSPL